MSNNGREKLLLQMYDQMFNDINRHIMVVWQSIGVVIGAFAVFALVQRNVFSIDVAIGIIILLCAWSIAHSYDANYWYNRNLAIIANIERQFLKAEDLRDIHYYFGKHRPNKMLTHLWIQGVLAFGIAGAVLFYHFYTRILPAFDALRALPYIITIIATVGVKWQIVDRRKKDYCEFIENSPGINVDTSGIRYGSGHGFSGRKTGESDMTKATSTKRSRIFTIAYLIAGILFLVVGIRSYYKGDLVSTVIEIVAGVGFLMGALGGYISGTGAKKTQPSTKQSGK